MISHSSIVRDRIEALKPSKINALLLGVFIVFKIYFYCLGIRFNLESLTDYWQYLDIALLQNDLLRSVFYQHSQPPLFNLFLGWGLKLFPLHYGIFFALIFSLCQFLLYLLLFRLMVELSVRKTIAFVFSTLFLFSPSFVYYGSTLSYTLPLALLLTASAYFLLTSLKTGKTAGYWLFFFIIFSICGIRSLYHLAYYIAVVLFVLWASKKNRKNIIIAALIPFILLSGIYVKNYILFEKFTTSTWMGMNFWDHLNFKASPDVLEKEISEGTVSPLVRTTRFSPLQKYPQSFQIIRTEYKNIPALADADKSSGNPNYNNYAYIGISDQYLKDALYLYRKYPVLWIKRNIESWLFYAKSSSDYFMIQRRQDRILGWEKLYDYLFYGKVPRDFKGQHSIYLFLWIGLPLVVLYGLRIFFKNKPSEIYDFSQRFVILFIVFNIVYVALVGNLLECLENNRFRFMTDPLALTLFALLCNNLKWFGKKV